MVEKKNVSIQFDKDDWLALREYAFKRKMSMAGAIKNELGELMKKIRAEKSKSCPSCFRPTPKNTNYCRKCRRKEI